jgi:hypothetical protein
MIIDLSDPICTIDHVAAAVHVSVDTAREYTYRADSPAPRTGFSRNLWPRAAVLAWFDGLPPRARRATRPAATGRPDVPRPVAGPRAAPTVRPTPAPVRLKRYSPRAR